MSNTPSKQQLEKIFDQLPEELQDAIFSMETAKNISDICERHEITDEKVSKIAETVGQVLFGLLKASDFATTIEKELNIPTVKAKAIAQEINRFIFYPVKPLLDKITSMEEDPASNETVLSKQPIKEKPLEIENNIPNTKSTNDTYRESIE